MTEHPNVFVLSIDSLPYSWFENYSRQLAELINGVNFTDAIAPASYTSSAMPALVTGTHTDELEAWGLPESGGPSPVAENFSQAGYDCGLWTDNYLFGAEYNYDRGFSAGNLGQPGRKKQLINVIKESPLEPAFGLFEFLYFNALQPLQAVGGRGNSFYRNAHSLNEQVLDWFQNRDLDSTTFCWLHYMDAHHPYQPPNEYLDSRSFNERRSRSKFGEFTRNAIKSNGDELTDEELEDLKTVYEACCEYTFDQLVSFITTLEDRGYFNPSSDIIVITADHGEILDPDKYGMLGHVPPAFWDEIVKVPFVIGCPDWPRSTFEKQVSLLDLKETLLSLAGIKSKGINQPIDIHRERVTMVSEWEDVNNESVTTFRGIRSESGRKCFGARQKSVDKIICTTFDEDQENAVEIKNVEKGVKVRDLPSDYKQFNSEISDQGGFIQYRSLDPVDDHGANEEHLRDLGYLE